MTSAPQFTFRDAVIEALAEEMARDRAVVLIGEDVGAAGGVFHQTKGLLARFGPEHVIDTPISEAGFIGMAVGAAMSGLRPVTEVMFGDFITLGMDLLVNQAAKVHWMSNGQFQVPLVVRTAVGVGGATGPQHSQSFHAWFAHVPGLKVVFPSNPGDAKALMKGAIRDNNPVIFSKTG
jgi:acetoin:2,6-dichlorophenolindophenol oxidoreductase subunit beta